MGGQVIETYADKVLKKADEMVKKAEEANQKTIIRMMKKGMDVEEISELTDTSLEEIEKIKNNI